MRKLDRRHQIVHNNALVLAAAICFAVTSISAQVRKPEAASAMRSITVVSEPNAIVWIDNVKYGKTADTGRLAISTIAPGRRVVRVRAGGFKETTKALLPSQRGDIEIPLTRTTDEAELAYQQAEVLAAADREKAAEAYKKAMRLRPQYIEAHIGLARLYSETGDREKAEAALQSVRRLKPASSEASVIEGRTFKDSGEDEKAAASFKRAITQAGGFQPEAYTGLGLIYKERAEGAGTAGDYDGESANYIEAAKYFATALKQLSGAPDAVVLYQFLGLVYEQQKKYKEAIAVYKEFLRLFPDSPEAVAFASFIVQLQKQINAQN